MKTKNSDTSSVVVYAVVFLFCVIAILLEKTPAFWYFVVVSAAILLGFLIVRKFRAQRNSN